MGVVVLLYAITYIENKINFRELNYFSYFDEN